MAFVTWLDLLAVLASCCLSFFSYLLIFWKKGQAWDFPGGPPASLDGRAVWGEVREYSFMSNSAIPRTVAHQAPLSMGFARQEYWSGLSFLIPGDLLNLEVESSSPALAGGFVTTEPSGNPCMAESLRCSPESMTTFVTGCLLFFSRSVVSNSLPLHGL